MRQRFADRSQNRRFLLALLSIFQPIGVVVCSAIAYGFIPKYGCQPDFTRPNALKSCKLVPAGTPCCSKADNMGWRYLLYTLGGITLFVFFARFVLFRFQESPKFLVYRGNDEKAVKVLDHIAKFNGVTNNVTLEAFHQIEEEHNLTLSGSELGAVSKRIHLTYKQKFLREIGRYKMLFSSRQMTRLTILTWLTYICDFWGFTVAGEFNLCPLSVFAN